LVIMPELAPLDLLVQPRAANTLRAYAADWRHFSAWCSRQGLSCLPADPSAVIQYAAECGSALGVATIERRMAAIAWWHRQQGLESPTHRTPVRRALQSLRRQRGAPPSSKDPVLPADLITLLSAVPSSLPGLRDRALLLAGFLGGFRRSELVSLDVADLDFRPEGVAVQLRRSKTDQEGRGRRVGLPAHADPSLCPVRVLRRWLSAAAISSGPVFRPIDRHGSVQAARLSGQAVGIVLKRDAAITDLNPDRWSAHSLRTGLVTAAARVGKPERVIMAQTGHRSTKIVRRYIREAVLFQENAADGLL
jgi:integrase